MTRSYSYTSSALSREPCKKIYVSTIRRKISPTPPIKSKINQPAKQPHYKIG